MQVAHSVASVFSDCFKRKHGVSKESASDTYLTPGPAIDISPVYLQPCTPGTDCGSATLDPARWAESNRLANAAAAWQIRRMMPVEAAALDEPAMSKMTTPDIARRVNAYPILLVLRGDNAMLDQLPLELLSAKAFAGLTLLERRAIHNVLAERPSGWSEAQLSLYAERECELIAMATESRYGDGLTELYSVDLPLVYSAYAQEPRGWRKEGSQ
ncbi:unnamed protein product [Phytophthora fragariaefolia]|uniref:Unnamed protein product n=1 Tax=Phytophthora fragariaefolia TaxID=1490495 RepID=A0A9W6YGR2_9STRA|nr:unnamed protein product [Phytophthora fragariaefolia]